MSIVISSEQVQQLLAGSRRLNQMKAEIDAVVEMALGLLTKAELSRFHYDAVVCVFVTYGLNWKVTKTKRGLAVTAHFASSSCDWLSVYDSFWGTGQMAREYVQLVHQALPALLTNLIEVFPSLNDRFAMFLALAPR